MLQPSARTSSDLEVQLLADEKKKVIQTIKKLKLRVTPPELAAASGLSINQSSFWLNKVAGETEGALDVANDGTIYYSFKPNFTDAYMKRGFEKTMLVIGSILFQLLYWAVRVSFGLILIASLLIIVVIFIILIMMAIAAMFGDSDSGGDGIDLTGIGEWFDLRFLFDLFYWGYSPSVTYYPNSTPSYRQEKYISYVEEKPKGNFFLEVFSFLFGDGPPNKNLNEIRWQQIARVIRENGGVVSTEQLAPFLDGDRSDSGMILSALAQFNGRPEVTPSGYIVYVFPEMLAGDFQSAPNQRAMTYLEEDAWRFSAFPAETQLKVLILACLNFIGSWWLFKHIATITLLSYLAVLIDVLLVYAIVLLAIPTIRFLVISYLNARIDLRNERRFIAYQLVNNPKGDVLEEIQEAAEIREQELLKLQPQGQIIYTTERDSLEQQFDER